VTEGEAAPAAAAEQDSRNLLMRVIAALVLAPLAIAIAYAGGWLWTALVTLAAIGLYVEWLMIVGAGARRAWSRQGRLRLRSPDFASRRANRCGACVLALGLLRCVDLRRSKRNWARRDFAMPPRPRNRIGAGAPRSRLPDSSR
jgi:phosphatidate cytidylyltransferase